MSVLSEQFSTCFPTIPVERDRQKGSGGEGEQGKRETKGDVIHTERDTLMMLSDSLQAFERTFGCVCECASACTCAD